MKKKAAIEITRCLLVRVEAIARYRRHHGESLGEQRDDAYPGKGDQPLGSSCSACQASMASLADRKASTPAGMPQ
ncbi:hypothetical protein SIN8267_01838 [Sinobacterium norvegicum]|uniref:Uncharacterized protein n=1 Tax=Sinobacterium norvegicum TaxID=1641715 RepID=A0ABM9AEV0_9GAMM|nr:hypothetical protein SIN8267_01838 [Sinobacterium norvegicum]